MDAGIGLVGGTASVVQGVGKLGQLSNLAKASGMSLKRANDLWEVGSQALNNADFLSLGGHGTNALQKGLAIANGAKLTTSALQGAWKGLQLFLPTGLTPSGDIAAGAAAQMSTVTCD